MPRHRTTKKRNLKKKVKRNIQKIKEITAEDILLNPALVYSPQFKQLPIEKQIMLMNQVKQLKAMMGRTNMPASHSSSGGGGDSSLFARLNEMNNKISRQENENEQLRASLQASTATYQREKELNKEIRRKAQDQKDSIDQAARIDDLEQQLHRLNVLAEDAKTNRLRKEIKEKKKQTNYDHLQDLTKTNITLQHELNTIKKLIRPFTREGEGAKRIKSERINQSKNNRIEKQSIFQTQINEYTNNGEYDKAEETEKTLNLNLDDSTSTLSDVFKNHDKEDKEKKPEYEFDFKKKLKTEPSDDIIRYPDAEAEEEEEKYEETETENNNNDDDDDDDDLITPLISPVENQAIKTKVNLNQQIKTKKEQVEQFEELNKIKQENQRAYERNLSQQSKQNFLSTTGKIDLEAKKSQLLENLDGLLNMLDNPDTQYKISITNKIKKASTFEELDNITKKLTYDKGNQVEYVKQAEFIENKRNYIRNLIMSMNTNSIQGFQFSYDTWNSKIVKANTIDDLLKIEQMINQYKEASEILAEDARNQKQESEDSNTNKIAKAKANEAVDTLIKVQEFLKTDNMSKKPVIYVDADKEKNFSPDTKALRPSKDFEYVSLKEYKFNPSSDSIPNEILLNGVNIGNLAQRLGQSTEKGKFFASLAYKLGCYAQDNSKKLFFWLVKFGSQLIIAAVPATINFAAQHPIMASSAIGGFVGYKWLKNKFFNVDNEDDLAENADKIDDSKIIPPPQPGPSPLPPDILTDFDPYLPKRITPLNKPSSFPASLRKKPPKQSPPKVRKMFKKTIQLSPNENNDL